jgi:phosphoribosylanthranilate isomerase
MIIQIYEIQEPSEAQKCIELGVDHIGSVLLSEEGWRVPSIKDVCNLTNGTGVKNSLIPLFKTPDAIYRALDFYRPHFVHFCDSLTDKEGARIDLSWFIKLQSEVKKRFPEIGVIRSIPIPPKGASVSLSTLDIAADLEPVSDIFLTDTWLGMEPVEGYIGITGKTVDWRIAKSLVSHSRIPVILAGGLSPFNVYEAMVETGAAGADSCTKTNMLDENGRPVRFMKDFTRVEKFVNEVRRAGDEKAVMSREGRGHYRANRLDHA